MSNAIEDMNNTINQPALTDIYRTLHSTAEAYIFSSSTHKICTKIDYVWAIKMSEFKVIEVIQSIFSD